VLILKIMATANSVDRRINNMDKRLREAFSGIREELEDHLTAINENTNEIQGNYEFMCQLETKIDKLTERLDELQMMLMGGPKHVNVAPLTMREREVFLVIYANEKLTFGDIARKTALPENLVSAYVGNLIRKGIPLIKVINDGMEFISLDSGFRALQAKENILGINESFSMSVSH